MDLWLEADSGNTPISKDCFFSVRIGDVQKQYRYDPTRTYHFPEMSDKRYGRVDLFKHVGSVQVNVDPAISGPRDLVMSCSDGSGDVNLKLDLRKSNVKSSKMMSEPEATKKKEAKDKRAEVVLQGKTFLSKSGIEDILFDSMTNLLREKPANPRKWLSDYILNAPSKERKLPPLEKKSSEQEKAAGTKERSQSRSGLRASQSTPSLQAGRPNELTKATGTIERPQSRSGLPVGQKLPPLQHEVSPDFRHSHMAMPIEPVAKQSTAPPELVEKPVEKKSTECMKCAVSNPFGSKEEYKELCPQCAAADYYKSHFRHCKQQWFDDLYQKFPSSKSKQSGAPPKPVEFTAEEKKVSPLEHEAVKPAAVTVSNPVTECVKCSILSTNPFGQTKEVCLQCTVQAYYKSNFRQCKQQWFDQLYQKFPSSTFTHSGTPPKLVEFTAEEKSSPSLEHDIVKPAAVISSNAVPACMQCAAGNPFGQNNKEVCPQCAVQAYYKANFRCCKQQFFDDIYQKFS
eukprot:gnl/MRDRNA2_/MRDRNA2_127076_c0_seq1.p1 gnl/MRDRNA2_/MRDRNA2_127076_c0~~gnl/MRDRNA2_/MRDRNA2_127076_c0_seq1.p1  ORF type:complete len:513 (-),score=100.66 gnl/MRDRNA2_/MRDRNA2_127076_c0_seq1:23-1561(-)